jgi:hypothetical protein
MKRLMAALSFSLLFMAAACTQAFASEGAYYIVRSDTGTAYNKTSGNINLAEVSLAVPGTRPVPYFFLGAWDSTGYNAEAGIYYDYNLDKWRPFAFLASGKDANGVPIQTWYAPSNNPYIDKTDSIQIVFTVLDNQIKWTINNWTKGTSHDYYANVARTSSWGAATKFNANGSGMKMYREVSLAFDANKEDFSVNAKFTGAHWRDVYLYGPSGYWLWTSSRTSSTTTYPSNDASVISVTKNGSHYDDIVDIKYGMYR